MKHEKRKISFRSQLNAVRRPTGSITIQLLTWQRFISGSRLQDSAVSDGSVLYTYAEQSAGDLVWGKAGNRSSQGPLFSGSVVGDAVERHS